MREVRLLCVRLDPWLRVALCERKKQSAAVRSTHTRGGNIIHTKLEKAPGGGLLSVVTSLLFFLHC